MVGRAAQFMPAIRQAADFHLTSVKFSFADDASAFVIERLPGSNSISCPQYGEPVIKFEMSDHNAKSSLLLASTSTIRPLDDCVVG
ncbi:MAG: hypothetical protein DMF12_04810 [Verrucomicrobia bacterium]|nr:MAG: hypothetical protein DMF12_04810 [Verrucomicrobiota bacterium]